jgi:hypothetical protein
VNPVRDVASSLVSLRGKKHDKKGETCYAPKSEKGKGTFVNFSMNIQANLFKIIAGGEGHHL